MFHCWEISCVVDVEYKDSITDVLFIAMCRKAYGALAGWQSERDWWNGEETYEGMVEVSRALMQVWSLICFNELSAQQGVGQNSKATAICSDFWFPSSSPMVQRSVPLL